MAKIIIDPENKYYVISLKHTGPKDKYITLWRPDNAGYCWPLELAGQYDGYQENYHNSPPENIPILVTALPPEWLVKDDRNRYCIVNKRPVRKAIKEQKWKPHASAVLKTENSKL